jgi:hypothetical protein
MKCEPAIQCKWVVVPNQLSVSLHRPPRKQPVIPGMDSLSRCMNDDIRYMSSIFFYLISIDFYQAKIYYNVTYRKVSYPGRSIACQKSTRCS